jgi:hypothetical protein
MTLGTMKKKEFEKYRDRDKSCPHCGTTGPELIPQHRANRGMGGSKSRNRPSNIIAFCSLGNGLMESNATFASLARSYGWKILSYQDPSKTPVRLSDGWYLLDDNFGKARTAEPEQE